ncbi:MAG: ABC transporter substrate-binding protein [Actinomycetota bacterium]|nr:MAG: ABC transporter substrate-binding protein [Actinomycetota bacterium]
MNVTKYLRPNLRSGAGRFRLLAAGGAVLLAGCGSSTAASSTTTTAASTTTTAALPTVTIAKPVNVEETVLGDVTNQLGYFRPAGVNVKSILLGGSSVANAALQNGSVQFTIVSASSLLLAAAHNVPLYAVGAINIGDTVQLVVSNAWLKAHNLSPSQPLATRIKGLEGSVDGTISSTDKSAMTDFESQAGVSPSSIKEESITSVTALLSALQHGSIDEFIASPPNSSVAVSGGYGSVLASASELPYAGDEIFDILVTTKSYAEAHPKIVTAVTSAISKALTQLSTQTPAGVAAMNASFPTLSSSVIKDSLSGIKWSPSMQMSQKGWDDALTLAQKSGLLKSNQQVNVQEGGIWTNQYLK